MHSNRRNGTAEQFQWFTQLICHVNFLTSIDIYIYDNIAIHLRGDNDTLMNSLQNIGIDIINLPVYSPELNSIELIFNVIV